MSLYGPDFILKKPFSDIATNLLEQLTPDEISQLPYDVIHKVMGHQDVTKFISDIRPTIILTDIANSYSVYDKDHGFLFKVNLHKGVFGSTIPERSYILLMSEYESIFITYIDIAGNLRNIQAIKL